jgi:hypothetical protein
MGLPGRTFIFSQAAWIRKKIDDRSDVLAASGLDIAFVYRYISPAYRAIQSLF